MGAGALKINGGAQGLMDATFSYNVDTWKPQVDYAVSDGKGKLTVQQPSAGTIVLRDVRNDWDIRLNNAVPMDLAVDLGAGKGEITLGGLALQSIRFNAGAGDVTVDLTGKWEHDVNVDIKGGAGRLTMRLPKDVGVRIKAVTGLGSVQTDGLTKHDDVYENDAVGTSPATLNIDIAAGVGQVVLDVVQ
jgi:hypothetical protein